MCIHSFFKILSKEKRQRCIKYWGLPSVLKSELVSMRLRIPDQGSQPMLIHTDPNTGQTLSSQKAEFLHKNIPVTTLVQKPIERLEIRFIC